MTAYPIIVVHYGAAEYLSICLEQAHFSNPNSRIILLGDENNKDCPAFVEHYLIKDFNSRARDFEKIYQHFSPNSIGGELFCIQRWFIIEDFIRNQKLDRFLHIDSDVLVYSDFSREEALLARLEKHDFNITETSGHTSFFTTKAVEMFCLHIEQIYRDTELLRKIARCYKNKETFHSVLGYSGGSLQDMALLTSFSHDPHVKSFDSSKVLDGAVFSLVIGYPRCADFSNTGDMISVVFNNRIPFSIEKKSNNLVRFHTLHFQGGYKCLMGAFATFDKDPNWTSPLLGIKELQAIYGFTLPPTQRKFSILGLFRKLLRKVKLYVTQVK